jgi:hypothetical protein
MAKLNMRCKYPAGIRRAGLQVTHAGIDVDSDSITDAQLRLLEADPAIIVTRAPDKAPDVGLDDGAPRKRARR